MEQVNLSQYAEVVEAVQENEITRARRKAEKLEQEIVQRAELKEKNIKRNGEATRQRIRANQMKARYEEQKEIHNQLGVAIGEMLRQFAVELQSLLLIAVGTLHDREAVGRRKDQMSIMKETMATIQMLQKMQEALEEKYNLKKEDVKDGRGDNVLLMKDAAKLLKKSGVK